MTQKSFTGTVVDVTQKFIEKGEPSDDKKCPIALAVRAACKQSVSVGSELTIGKELYALPKAATNFISKFDDAGPINRPKPFSFKIGKRIE